MISSISLCIKLWNLYDCKAVNQMMAISGKDTFSFTWQIENFSMCPHPHKEGIESPIFTVCDTKWRCDIFPRGNVDPNHTACFLKIISSARKKKEPREGNYEIILHSVRAGKNLHFNSVKTIFRSNYWGIYASFPRKDVLTRMNGFLPNDILTIEGRIWESIDVEDNITKSSISWDLNFPISDSSAKQDMLFTAARDEFLDFQTQFASSHYLARTCIRVGRKSILWPVRRFNTLEPHQRLTIPVIRSGIYGPSFAMTLYINRKSDVDQSIEIEIRVANSELTKVCFVRCRITAVNSLIKSQLSAEDEHFFAPTNMNDVWKFPTFLQKTALIEEKYFNANQGTLNLRCEFAFSSKENEFRVDDIDAVPLRNQFPKPVEGNFNDICKQMYVERKFSDVILQSDDQIFKAHKSFLSIRSPVFRAMFETDMMENETGVVNITDSGPDTLEQFLTYIYTNSLEDLQPAKAIKLYAMADKYEVLSLKSLCSNFLKSTLSIANVCEVLILADLHQDRDLLDDIQNYIQLNSHVILHSQMWKDLMKSNSSLASNVMLQLLIGKVDH